MSYAVLRFYKLNKFLHASIDIFPFFPDKADLLLNNRNNGNSHQPRKIFQKEEYKNAPPRSFWMKFLMVKSWLACMITLGLIPARSK